MAHINDEQPERDLDPVRDNVEPTREPLQPGRVSGRSSPGSWREALGPLDERTLSAYSRLTAFEDALYHQYLKRRLSDPAYALPRLQNEAKREDPDYVGPVIEDDFPEFDYESDLFLAEVGRFVAAMGGYLELRAVFPDENALLLQEPGPEHLHDGAS